jgi:predicted benzoate:H+ symporter BenE
MNDDTTQPSELATVRRWIMAFGSGLAVLGAVLFVGGLLLFLELPLAAWIALIAGVASVGVGGSLRAAVTPESARASD